MKETAMTTTYQMNETIRAAGLDPASMTDGERQECYDRIASAGYATPRRLQDVPADASRDDLIAALVAMRTGDELKIEDEGDQPWRILLMHGRAPATPGNLESFYFIDGQDGEYPVVCKNAHEAADWITTYREEEIAPIS